MVKENKKKLTLALLILLLLAGWFYWFQYRPAQIKHDCSWVKHHSDAIPIRPIMTEEELRANGILSDCKPDAKYNDILYNPDLNTFSGRLLDDLLSGKYCKESNKKIIDEYRQVKPAVPAKDWWEKSTDTEYKFCLRDKGL